MPHGVQPVLGNEVEEGAGLFRRPDHDGGELLAGLLPPGDPLPWAEGGPTTTENGQALCEVCNLKKGQQMQWADNFVPRPFQREVSTVVLRSLGSSVLAVDLGRGDGVLGESTVRRPGVTGE